MMFHQQLLNHDPKNGISGDCFRTAIACLLDIAPKEVPHTFGLNVDVEDAFDAMDEYLKQFGLCYVEIPVQGDKTLGEVLSYCAARFPRTRHILVGKSGPETNHAVICNRGKIEHNPSSSSHLIGPAKCYDGYDYWLVGCLVKLV